MTPSVFAKKYATFTLGIVVLIVVGFGFIGVIGAIHVGRGSSTHSSSNLLPSASPFWKVISSKSGTGGGGTNSGGSCASTPAPASNTVAYSPSQVASAYSYSNAMGSGKTIAIIDAYGSSSLTSDVACFDKIFGLPAPNLQVVYPFGTPHVKSSGWGLETSLDVEWAHAMAPAASILLIVTPSNSLTYLVNDAIPYAVQHGANVISMSWGAAESSLGCATENSEASYFSQAASNGVILVSAAGDNGAKDGTSAPTVNYPAADPSVVGVGGTSLQVTNTNTWSGESVWNDATGATGGGISTCFSEPAYQSSHGILSTTSAGSVIPAGRAVPDVAYDSDPNTGFWVYDTSGYSGWVQVGGTSAASPQWAAIFVDAQSSSSTTTALTGNNVHVLLYGLTTTSAHDITSGNNGYYYASPGYDACTGIGTPIESSTITGL